MSDERIENLKRMYKKYVLMGHPNAATRTLTRLRELGVSEEEVKALTLENG